MYHQRRIQCAKSEFYAMETKNRTKRRKNTLKRKLPHFKHPTTLQEVNEVDNNDDDDCSNDNSKNGEKAKKFEEVVRDFIMR